MNILYYKSNNNTVNLRPQSIRNNFMTIIQNVKSTLTTLIKKNHEANFLLGIPIIKVKKDR
jgi:hypothetical protein